MNTLAQNHLHFQNLGMNSFKSVLQLLASIKEKGSMNHYCNHLTWVWFWMPSLHHQEGEYNSRCNLGLYGNDMESSRSLLFLFLFLLKSLYVWVISEERFQSFGYVCSANKGVPNFPRIFDQKVSIKHIFQVEKSLFAFYIIL